MVTEQREWSATRKSQRHGGGEERGDTRGLALFVLFHPPGGLNFEGCRGLEMKEVRTRVVVILGAPRDGHLRRRKIGKPAVQ